MNIERQQRDQSTGKQRRHFSHELKNQCWEKASIVVGRDPSRWRMDPFGNPVMYYLKNCHGPYCYEYDHVMPFSKGGESSLENCQILQTRLNRVKSAREDITFSQLRNLSALRNFSDNEMDVIEQAVYGDIKKLTLEQQVNFQSSLQQNQKLHK